MFLSQLLSFILHIRSASHMGARFKGGWYCSASKENCSRAGASYYDFCTSDTSADIKRKLEPFVPYTDSCHAGFFGGNVTNTSQIAVPGVVPFSNNLCYRELIPGYSQLAGTASICTQDFSSEVLRNHRIQIPM